MKQVASPCGYPSYFGSLTILNALSRKILSAAVLLFKSLRSPISHIMLKTSFTLFVLINISQISCFFNFFYSLFTFSKWTTSLYVNPDCLKFISGINLSLYIILCFFKKENQTKEFDLMEFSYAT